MKVFAKLRTVSMAVFICSGCGGLEGQTVEDQRSVGSADQPMYFTEKHVQEASIFVVI